MKTILLTALVTTGFIVLTGIINKTMAKTETQQYETIYREGNFEIRFYPEAILATVTMDGSFDDSRNSGFRILAGYIFGGNAENQKIAMTSPVRMKTQNETSTMSFVLPSKIEFDKLPKPLSDKIVLHHSKPVYAAVVKYGGYTNNQEIEKKKTELKKVLQNHGIAYKENFEYLGYNPPFQLINRKNEVLVELNNFNPDEFQKIMAQQ